MDGMVGGTGRGQVTDGMRRLGLRLGGAVGGYVCYVAED